MRKYFLDIVYGLSKMTASVNAFIRRTPSKISISLGLFALFFIPTLVFAWLYDGGSPSADSKAGINDTSNETIQLKMWEPTVFEVADSDEGQNITLESDDTTIISTDNQSSRMNVIVNNQPVAVPENGSSYTEINNSNGRTSIDISTDSSSSSSSESRSNLKIKVRSTSETKVDSSQ